MTNDLDDEEDGPDWMDLEEWISEHHPQMRQALRYSTPSIAFEAYRKVWVEAGRPQLEQS